MAEQKTTMNVVDEDIRDAVMQAMKGDNIIRESRAILDVKVQDEVVTVSGNTLTDTIRDHALFAAAQTPGVKKVLDYVASDTRIEERIAHGMASHPALKGQQVSVIPSSYLGVVQLMGEVDTGDQRAQIAELAAGVAGVRQVIDMLVAAEDVEPDADEES